MDRSGVRHGRGSRHLPPRARLLAVPSAQERRDPPAGRGLSSANDGCAKKLDSGYLSMAMYSNVPIHTADGNVLQRSGLLLRDDWVFRRVALGRCLHVASLDHSAVPVEDNIERVIYRTLRRVICSLAGLRGASRRMAVRDTNSARCLFHTSPRPQRPAGDVQSLVTYVPLRHIPSRAPCLGKGRYCCEAVQRQRDRLCEFTARESRINLPSTHWCTVPVVSIFSSGLETFYQRAPGRIRGSGAVMGTGQLACGYRAHASLDRRVNFLRMCPRKLL